MRILHTADWHLGKKLSRIDRRNEFEAVLDEVVEIARDQKIDATVVAGDLLDRAMPGFDAIHLMLDALVRLAEVGTSVVAIAGNHDSAELFEILAPLVSHRGIILASKIARPDEGGVVKVTSNDGSEEASLAVMPFLHQSQVVDFMESSEEWFKSYDTKIRNLSKQLVDSCDPASPVVLAGHFFVDGAELGGSERKIYVGPHYAATNHVVPANAAYAALGHVHRPQAIKGTAAPARYAGSLLQLDFSESNHEKEVVVVEVASGRPAKVESIALTSGRRLIRVTDSLEKLKSRANEFGDAFLDVRVQTSGPVFDIADQVREFLPQAVMVKAEWERDEVRPTVPISERSLAEAYEDFHSSAAGYGSPAPTAMVDAVKELEEEVLSAAD